MQSRIVTTVGLPHLQPFRLIGHCLKREKAIKCLEYSIELSEVETTNNLKSQLSGQNMPSSLEIHYQTR